MGAAVRVGDSTSGMCDVGSKCCPHERGGQCGEGSPNVFINGASAFRCGDTGQCNCAHGGNFQAIGGSSTVFINGAAAIRQGEETQCQNCGQSGEIEGGSSDVFIG